MQRARTSCSLPRTPRSFVRDPDSSCTDFQDHTPSCRRVHTTSASVSITGRRYYAVLSSADVTPPLRWPSDSQFPRSETLYAHSVWAWTYLVYMTELGADSDLVGSNSAASGGDHNRCAAGRSERLVRGGVGQRLGERWTSVEGISM